MQHATQKHIWSRGKIALPLHVDQVKLRRVSLFVRNSRVSYNYLKYDEFGDWPVSAHALREIHEPRMRTRRISLLRKVIREFYNKIKDSVCDFVLFFVQSIASDFLSIQFDEI